MRSSARVLPAVATRVHRTADRELAPAAAAGRPIHSRETLLVGLAQAPARQAVGTLPPSIEHRVSVLEHVTDLGIARIRVPNDVLGSTMRRLIRSRTVRYVERERRAYAADVVPNDPYFPTGAGALDGGEWGDVNTQATKAWDITTGSSTVTITIIDSGIDASHPDLQGRLVSGRNVLDGTSNTADNFGHGTYVAGAIAPSTDNGAGVAGYCWSCKLIPVKIYDSATGTSYGNLITGITWAVDHGAKVLNISMYGYSSSKALNDAVKYATDRGVVVVTAAGNDGCYCVSYPAASPDAIGVAGSNQKDTLYSYSNWGTWGNDRRSRIDRDHRAQLAQGLVRDSLISTEPWAEPRWRRRSWRASQADAVGNSGRNACAGTERWLQR